MTTHDGLTERRRANLRTRARIIQSIRAFFVAEGFLEIETPIVLPAPAPEAHIDAPYCDGGFLQTSPELAMKRLLAAGYQDIFQIARCFRSGERGSRHLPEFTMLEWYRPNADYNRLMDDCRRLFAAIAKDIGVVRVAYGGAEVDFCGTWQEVTVDEAYLDYAGIKTSDAIESGDFDLLMVERIEPNLGLGAPTILKDYPAKFGALARLKPTNPTVAERFEVYAAGVELANGFSELTDPIEQRARFEVERAERKARGNTVYPMPEKFLGDLGSMPPSAGIALGIDRLVMLFCGAKTIDEVVAFTPEEL